MFIKRKIAAALCAVMMISNFETSFSVLAAENLSGGVTKEVNNNTSDTTSESSVSHVVYGWNEESLTLHYETGYAPAWEALSSVLPTSVSANTNEGVVDVAIKGWTYNESYDVNKTGTYLIESVIDEKYALGDGVSNYAAFVVIEDVNHAVHFTGLDDLIVLPGSNVNVLDGVTASDGNIEYAVGISSITAVDGTGAEVDSESIELGEEEPVLFDVVDGYTYTINLVALDEFGEVTDSEPAVRLVYVRDIVQPRAPAMQLMSIQLPANPVSGVTSIDDFSVEFVSGGSTNSGAYIWNATRATSGHQFVYMISYSTSGVGTSEPGALEIRIPLHLIKNRLGQYADTIEMSVPHEDEITEEDVEDGSVEYAYRIEGDEVVFFNVAEVSAAVNGYFEVAYSMDLSTFNYVDMEHSDEMWARMSIGSHTAEDTEWPVGINTTAKINSTSKRFPTLYSSWQSAWGDTPADADDYYYLVWEVRSIVDDYITQPYSLEFTDIPSSDNGTVEVVAYKFSGQSSYTTNNVIPESTSSGYRYDYVLTRHSKAEFQPLDKYLIHNNVSITLTPIDGIDAPSIARSSRDFPWERPEFKYPTGHFMTYKRGDGAYRNRYNTYNYSYLTDLGFRNAKYTRYDLQEFSGKDDEEITREYLDGFDYAVWTVGYPYPWTLATGADWHDPSNFGQVPVRYEQIDEGVYLSADGGPDSDRELTSDDFQIDTLAYQVQIGDAQYNTETCVFDSITGTFLTSDVLNIYTKSVNNDNNWLLSATVQLDTGVVTIVTSDRITEAENATLVNSGKTKGFITFSNNVVAYKLETSNAHYFTEIDSVPNMRLKNDCRSGFHRHQE